MYLSGGEMNIIKIWLGEGGTSYKSLGTSGLSYSTNVPKHKQAFHQKNKKNYKSKNSTSRRKQSSTQIKKVPHPK
jgi:hypothetical protein